MSDYATWRGRLATANDPVFWPIEAIDTMLREGRAQFWGTDKSALITLVTSYPGGAVVIEVLAGTGSMADLIKRVRPKVEAWGRQYGCTHIQIKGRPGWARTLKPHGFRHFQDILMKGL
jgi:hypothetical protein